MALPFQTLVKSLAVEVAGAFVEQAGGETGGAGFIGLVLAGAAVEGEAERDQRHGLLAHQPGLDPGGTDDAFDTASPRQAGAASRASSASAAICEFPHHDFFSACALVSLTR